MLGEKSDFSEYLINVLDCSKHVYYAFKVGSTGIYYMYVAQKNEFKGSIGAFEPTGHSRSNMVGWRSRQMAY